MKIHSINYNTPNYLQTKHNKYKTQHTFQQTEQSFKGYKSAIKGAVYLGGIGTVIGAFASIGSSIPILIGMLNYGIPSTIFGGFLGFGIQDE